MAASDNSNDKLFGLLSYLLAPIMGIIILVTDSMKVKPYLKTHAVQGIAMSVVLIVIAFILTATVIGSCAVPFLIIIPIIFGIQAYQMKDVNIPVLTDFCKKQGWI